MTNKHTPGPWFAVQPKHCNGWWVVSTDEDGWDTVDDSGDGGFEESNARLISAAPELLDSLIRAERKLSAYVGVCTGDKELNDAILPMVRAAIAKATGA